MSSIAETLFTIGNPFHFSEIAPCFQGLEPSEFDQLYSPGIQQVFIQFMEEAMASRKEVTFHFEGFFGKRKFTIIPSENGTGIARVILRPDPTRDEIIGRGITKKAWRCYDLKTHEHVAEVRSCHEKNTKNILQLKETFTELKILKEMRYPHVYLIEEFEDETTYEVAYLMRIGKPFVDLTQKPISLTNYDFDKVPFPGFPFYDDLCNRLNLCEDILEKLMHLHESGKIYGDIKTANCLCFADNTATLIDMGQVRDVSDPERERFTVHMGTLEYTAPEFALALLANSCLQSYAKEDQIGKLAQQTGRGQIAFFEELYGRATPVTCHKSQAADIYAFGLVLIQMLTTCNQTPLGSSGLNETKNGFARCWFHIGVQEHPEENLKDDSYLPPRLIDLIKRMVSKNPGERPTAREALIILRNLHLPSDSEQ